MHPEPNFPERRFNTWSDLRCRLFYVYRGRVRDRYLDWKFLGWPSCAWLILKGQARVRFGEEEETAKAGQWLFLRNQDGHQWLSRDIQIMSIRFYVAWPSGGLLFEPQRSLVLEETRLPELRERTQELLEVVRGRLGNPEMELPLYHENLETHFALMSSFHRWCEVYVRAMRTLGAAVNAPEEMDPRIQRALTWLENHPFTSPWNERMLAWHAGLSVSQLNRLFVRHCGVTPLHYHEARRLKTACELLFAESEDIKAVAYQLGFSSPGNFSTWFRKHKGMTPTAWRRSAPDTSNSL